jgi:hypothetical protein
LRTLSQQSRNKANYFSSQQNSLLTGDAPKSSFQKIEIPDLFGQQSDFGNSVAEVQKFFNGSHHPAN